jgi:hypothetical protein
MNNRIPLLASAAAAALMLLGGAIAIPRVQAASSAPQQAPVEKIAKGDFDVNITPIGTEEKFEGSTIGHMASDKQFHGDLQGTSKGEMISVLTGVKGSAGYVAMELVTGTLAGRSGSFILQHTATMNRGEPQLSITVVPDSGTGQLTGIAGKLAINIVSGKHFYEFAYTLPEK